MKRDEQESIGNWGLEPNLSTRIIWHLALLVFCAIAVLPIYWMISTAIKPTSEIFQSNLSLIPRSFTLEHFHTLFTNFDMMRIFMNTFIVALSIMLAQLLTSLLAAYGFSRYRFPFRETLFYLCLGTMFVPIQVIMVSNYLFVTDLGFRDTLSGVVMTQLANAFGMFLLRQHLLVFPQPIIEAARMDNANEFVILFRIVLPTLRPVIGALAIILFVDGWNQYVWPSLLLSSTDSMTIPIWLKQFMHAEAGVNWGLLMSAATLGVIPIMFMYLIAHRQIISSFTSSGVKG